MAFRGRPKAWVGSEGRVRLLRALAATAVTVLVAGCSEPPPEVSSQPGSNVLFISIDTLRADHLGTYGYHRDTSPHLDAFADRSIVFERASSTSYFTADSHMSMFTSLYPSVHRVMTAEDVSHPLVVLSKNIETVTEVLDEAGYATAGFHGGGNVSATYGFDRGFDSYKKTGPGIDETVAWLEAHTGSPFFLFFHTYHTHDPYTPSPPYDTYFNPDYDGDVFGDKAVFDSLVQSQGFGAARKAFWDAVDPEDPADLEQVMSLYDGEIREVDLLIGELISFVEEKFPNTLIIVTSDHGEEFHEHGQFLHGQLYEELLHVPLIVRPPMFDGSRRVSERVSLIELAPMILTMVGLEIPTQFQGQGLWPLGSPGELLKDIVFAEKVLALGDQGISRNDPRHMALISEGLKVIETGRVKLFDLESDPKEQDDLAASHERVDRLVELMREIAARNNDLMEGYYSAETTDLGRLNEEDIENLKALGYIE